MKNKKKIYFIFYIFLYCLFIPHAYTKNSIYQLNADIIRYTDNNETIVAEGNSEAIDQYGKKIFADSIIYDKKNSIIKTIKNSRYIDGENEILAEFFLYDLKKKKILATNNVIYFDKNGNEFNFSEFEYFENSKKGFGTNIVGKLIDKSSLEGPVGEIDENKGIVIVKNNNQKKGFINEFLSLFNKSENRYTTCENKNNSNKNIKERCPDWSMSSTKTEHNSNKKMVYHQNAVIKLRNIPVFYTPYFSHPDPSVQRKSGFLNPSTKNFKNLGRTFKAPYFWDINDNTDLTFTPIFYQDENSIFLTEYRHQHNNGLIKIDSSYSKGYKDINKKGETGENLNRTSGSRNHFFLNFLGSYDNLFFETNDIEFNIQRISQKNYLNVNEINTNFVKQDISSLNNNIILNSFENNKRLKLSMNIYENLNDDNPNTKYQYIIPTIDFNNYFEKLNQQISLNNYFDAKNYNADSKQSTQINKIESASNEKIIKKIGITNTFKTKFSNINVYNDNISNAKENLNIDFISTFAVDSSLPLARFKNNGTDETLTPRIFSKYTPGSMSNANNDGKILNYGDIYSMDRMSNLTNPETGISFGYGVDYEMNKKNIENITYFKNKFSIGQVLNAKENKEMPTTSSLNKKTSNFVGNINMQYINNISNTENEILKNNTKDFNIQRGLNLSYNFNISNNLNKILQNDLKLSYENENNAFLTNYYEIHDIGNQQYIEGKYIKKLKNDLNIILTGRKNLETSYSENNSIEINYDSDCLKFGINLSKRFYESEDLKTNNNLNLFIMLKPFGQPVAPDLTNLISKD